ncbi:N-methylhydantoinase A/oxoprolinase/acetone carboxylase beta subunit [Kibdelosporangium banguiense]|uniref:N-methylhydantoinase A/oxoprolinase/acetone carboxylase beta subunit n=1 Tax=Kibdelosporangium banguiense TaxID=1365924 RepID=A0ABS4T7K2_9PSEU|nr:hydantoinase/oxoprolinase family protein [Kibdelosporangium banguiense]MBP2319914.1 N-methylhydantoinase A/oxoprolinase/acetone carboxylase beta subunit [Kibdelosporangium banguiense]
MRIGIDVGGTNTDAVLLSGDNQLLASVKTPTTPDVTDGVAWAVTDLLAAAAASGVLRRIGDLTAVMIGTTHFTNAIVQRRGLTPTAVVRLALPATGALPPLSGWPWDLRKTIGTEHYLVHGGYEYDGTELAAMDPDEIKRVAADVAERGLRSVAISSVFAPVNSEMELRAAEILRAEVPGLQISCSHEFGRIGLLERENATVLNASLTDLAAQIADALTAALTGAGITAPLLLSQNDGTVMDLEYARRFPVATFASGPTNSMRGAAFLAGLGDCAVVDVGGTTADIGVVTGGFPREAGAVTELGFVRTNFRMPDLLSLGIGGGSLVRGSEFGPDSVGYELTERALVFGGTDLTLTDLAVAAGLIDLGSPELVVDLDQSQVAGVLAAVGERIGEAVDRMRTSSEPLPVVVVGGGSVLVPDVLPGLDDIRRPENYAVANAVGAAIAEVGGEVDRVARIGSGRRERVLEEVKQEAVERAEAAGARPDTVRVVEVEEVPLAYVPGGAVRVRVKAVGQLDVVRLGAADA